MRGIVGTGMTRLDTKTIVDEINVDAVDKNSLVSSRISLPVVYIKGVGKFCGRKGCFKKIEGVLVRRMVYGIKKEYYRPPPVNKMYCSKRCRNIANLVKHPFVKSSMLMAGIKLEVVEGRTKYREMVIYYGRKAGGVHQKKLFKITPKDKELWGFLESVSRYTHMVRDKKEVSVIV